MPEATLDQDHMYDIDGVTVGTSASDWPALIEVSGLDVPEFRIDDHDRPQEHGMTLGTREFMTGRIIEMSIGAEHDYGTAAYRDAVNTLKQVMRPRTVEDEMVLRYRYNGESTRRLKVRPRRCEFVWDEVSYHGILRVNLQFLAGDPLIYDDEESTVELTYVPPTGGLGFPHGFPHGFGEISSSNFSTLTVDGTIPTAPYGKVTAQGSGIGSWYVENLTTGETFSMVLDMVGGSFLDFNFNEGTVLLDGTASRSRYVERPESTWWKLVPGDNVVRFGFEGDAAFVALNYRAAWI